MLPWLWVPASASWASGKIFSVAWAFGVAGSVLWVGSDCQCGMGFGVIGSTMGAGLISVAWAWGSFLVQSEEKPWRSDHHPKFHTTRTDHSCNQDVVFAMNNVPLPELPEPPPIVIEPPPSPPSPPSVPKTPAIPREKLLELEKLIQAFSNSLKRMQKDVHIEDMEDPAHKLQSPSNEGEGEDALARFDRALNVLRDFDMQLQDCSNQVTARLLAIDVERFAC